MVIKVPEENPSACPSCGSRELSWGPPDAQGGERYKVDALYCGSCGYVFYLVQFDLKTDKVRYFKEQE